MSDGDTSNWWAIGQEKSGCRCKYGGGYGIESDGGFRNRLAWGGMYYTESKR